MREFVYVRSMFFQITQDKPLSLNAGYYLFDVVFPMANVQTTGIKKDIPHQISRTEGQCIQDVVYIRIVIEGIRIIAAIKRTARQGYTQKEKQPFKFVLNHHVEIYKRESICGFPF